MSTAENNIALFKSKKNNENGWYKINSEGRKEWDKAKVSNFWKLIRKNKIDRNDYDFSYFVFPEYEFKYISEEDDIYDDWTTHLFSNTETLFQTEGFWRNGTMKEFPEPVNFKFAEFIGSFEFSYVTFHAIVDFTKAIFHHEVKFNDSTFLGGVKFFNVQFKGMVYFWHTNFLKSSLFQLGSFEQKVFFSRTIFSDCTEFRDVNPRYMEFLEIKGKDFNNSAHIKFTNIDFSEKIRFLYSNLSKLILVNSDISEAYIKRCTWNITNRLYLKDEYLNLEDSEEHYRQLKKKYDSIKNWELSGLAYVSEMEMRKKRLLHEKKYFTWIIFLIYDKLGGYTHDFIKPMRIFFFSTFIIFPVTYFTITTKFYGSNWNCTFYEAAKFNNLLPAYQKSLAASLPVLKTDLTYENWWVKSIQIFISTILIAFFLLAVRKRFKQ
ncbi:pentapeptide repeat-containing protein [uncultured Croceitalea sp.]|uniref:pentapeptide repeat-containing protein n=1 Tax=uncultured Croceitalea sp. TaxID=1798908 RepID=UPI00374EEE46